MKKVLIFGAGGFVGPYLTREFLEHGYTVTGSDKTNENKLPQSVKFIEADLLDEGTVRRIMTEEQPDMVVNLAGISSVGASWSIPQTTVSVNVIGALNIMEAVRKADKKPKLMFIGSSEEYVISDYPINEDRPLNASNPFAMIVNAFKSLRIYLKKSRT